MTASCCAKSAEVMLPACSGGSNAGRLTNQAAVELTREGFGALFCLAGNEGGLSGFVESAQDVHRVVFDGCPVGCAKAIVARAAITPAISVVVTDPGIDKIKDSCLSFDADAFDTVKRAACDGVPSGRAGFPFPCSGESRA